MTRQTSEVLRASAAIGLALAVGLLLAHTPSRGAEDAVVAIDNFAFTPETLRVKAGTRISFVNHDDIPHLVAASDGKYRSKALDTNERYEITFDRQGEYDYFCALHPHMKGKVIVEP
jgi:plastocyanin